MTPRLTSKRRAAGLALAPLSALLCLTAGCGTSVSVPNAHAVTGSQATGSRQAAPTAPGSASVPGLPTPAQAGPSPAGAELGLENAQCDDAVAMVEGYGSHIAQEPTRARKDADYGSLWMRLSKDTTAESDPVAALDMSTLGGDVLNARGDVDAGKPVPSDSKDLQQLISACASK